MPTRATVGLGAAAIGLVACGPAIGLPAGTSGGDPTSTTSTSAVSLAGPAATTSSDADTSGAATPDPFEGILCRDDVPQAPIGLIRGGQARILRADATSVDLDVPDSLPLDLYSADARARGAYFVASTWDWLREQPTSRIGLFRSTGEMVWFREETDTVITWPYVNEQGIVAAQRQVGLTSGGVTYSISGEPQTLPGLSPSGPVRGDGYVPGHVLDGPTHGWIDSASLTIQPASVPDPIKVITLDDGSFVYFAEIEGVLSFVHEDPEQVVHWPLADFAADPISLSVVASSNRAWFLLHDEAADGWFRVSMSDGVVEQIDPSLPDGFTQLECDALELADGVSRIDDAGGILVSARDAAAASIRRLDPVTGAWTQIGEPVTGVGDIEVQARGDTYLIATFEDACRQQVYEPGGARLSGTTWQVVYHVDGTARVIPPEDGYPVAARAGRCVTLVRDDGLTVLDLENGGELELPGAIEILWWDE